MIYAITLIILAYACDPALTALFTPPRPRLGRYEVCVTGEPLERARLSGWQLGRLELLEPLDAFGAAGPYDRPKLVQLYRGRRVEVQRGWKDEGGRFQSVTLLSPYPDASLTTLNQGTMIVRFTLDRDGS
jgi:hypothetical protein